MLVIYLQIVTSTGISKCMNERTVNRTLIDEWVTKRNPEGVSRLALRATVSASTIAKCRAGIVPAKLSTRKLLCEALEVTEDELFPTLARGNGKAS